MENLFRASTLGELKVRIDEAVEYLRSIGASADAYDVTIHKNDESGSDAITFSIDPEELIATF